MSRGEATRPAPLAFTCGDPAGVGPEIIADWLRANRREARDVAVIGPLRWLETLDTSARKIAVGPAGFSLKPGRPGAAGARRPASKTVSVPMPTIPPAIVPSSRIGSISTYGK